MFGNRPFDEDIDSLLRERFGALRFACRGNGRLYKYCIFRYGSTQAARIERPFGGVEPENHRLSGRRTHCHIQDEKSVKMVQ